MGAADETDLVSFDCYRPSCGTSVLAPLGAATPIYCSPACEVAADEEYAAAKERVEHLRDLLRRSRHWVAGFGRGDLGPDSGAPQAARDALAGARGALAGLEISGGPATDRERFVAEALSDLVRAVDVLLQDVT
jgi:hypothetical protein